MKIQYPFFIERGDKENAWGITFPDLPGCFSAADDESKILDSAREAALLHLEALEDFPEPSSLDAHGETAKNEGVVLGLLDIDLSQIEGPAKRVNITVPAGVLARIDAAAKRQGKTRSAFLTEAAIRDI